MHARRRQLPRRRARVEGRHRLPPEDRAGPIRSQLRHPGRAARGPAGTVIDRAREILQALERDELSRGGRPSVSGTRTDPQKQLGLFQPPAEKDDELRKRLAGVDVDRLTPLEALGLLAELKKEL